MPFLATVSGTYGVSDKFFAANPGDGSYFGPAYSAFSNLNPISFSTTIHSSNSSAPNVHDALDFFISHPNAKFYGGYPTVASYFWPNATQNYSSASMYVTGSQSTFSSSPIGTNGRGCTVAYLNDATRTEVLAVGHTSDGKIYFFRLSDDAYLGAMTATSGDLTGLAWDGFNLLVANTNDAVVRAYAIPSTISNGASLTASYSFTSPVTCFYGMVWTGNSIIMGSQTNNSNFTEFVRNGSGSTVIGSANKFNFGTSCYSIAIYYKNRVLVAG